MDLMFKEPLVARVQSPGVEPELVAIRGVRDGLAAVTRLGQGRHDTLEWQRAVKKLVQAALHPSSEDIEEARQALADLAELRKAGQ